MKYKAIRVPLTIYRVSVVVCLISIGCVTRYGKNRIWLAKARQITVFSVTRDTLNAY